MKSTLSEMNTDTMTVTITVPTEKEEKMKFYHTRRLFLDVWEYCLAFIPYIVVWFVSFMGFRLLTNLPTERAMLCATTIMLLYSLMGFDLVYDALMKDWKTHRENRVKMTLGKDAETKL